MALRRAGIDDTAVLAAIERVPREVFVPEVFAERAWEDTTLPIGRGQTISQPLVIARMTVALEPDRRLRILEIGTGSGYHTAILARLFRRVSTIERHRDLLAAAEERWLQLGVRNVTAMAGDGSRGWPAQGPFPRILVTAAAPGVPGPLVDQLEPGGILVAPVGEAHQAQRLLRIRRDDSGTRTEDLGPVRFVPLVPGDAGSGDEALAANSRDRA